MQPQLAAALLQPDSATNSLDVLSRASLLSFLRAEGTARLDLVLLDVVFPGEEMSGRSREMMAAASRQRLRCCLRWCSRLHFPLRCSYGLWRHKNSADHVPMQS